MSVRCLTIKYTTHKGLFVLSAQFGAVHEREGDHEVVEGACVTFSSDQIDCYALSLSRLRRQLPPGGSLTLSFLLPI